MERTLSVAQAAKILGMAGESGARHVRRLIRARKLHAEDHGSGHRPYWRIPESSLVEYMAARSPRDDADRTVH